MSTAVLPPPETDNAIDAARNAVSESLSAMKSVNSTLQRSYKGRISEYKEKFIPWEAGSRAQPVPARSVWSPNALYPEDLNASAWRSEYNGKYVEGQLHQPADPHAIAGISSAISGKCADSFTWGSNPPISSEYRDQFAAASEAAPKPHLTVEPADRPSPNSFYPEYADASQWRSENQVKFVEGLADPTTKTAGTVSVSSGKAEDSFVANPPSAPEVSEFRERFSAPDVSKVPSVAMIQRSRGNPNCVYPDELDASKWRSELQAKFAVAESSSSASNTVAAGIKASARINPPSNFAWSLYGQFAGVEAEDPSIPPGGIQSEPRPGHDKEPQTESSGNFLWPAVSVASAPKQKSFAPTAPNAVYADAVDTSAWRSEYDARCEALRNQVREELSRVVIAGVPTAHKIIVAPANFAWIPDPVETVRDSIGCEVPDDVHDTGNSNSSSSVARPTSATSEYRERFVGQSSADKLRLAAAPASNLGGVFDRNEHSNWATEYDDRYSNSSSNSSVSNKLNSTVARPSAPLPPGAADEPALEPEAAQLPTELQLEPQPQKPAAAVAPHEPSVTETGLPSKPVAEEALSKPATEPVVDMLKRSIKKRYTTEHAENFPWRDSGLQAHLCEPVSHMDGILYSSLNYVPKQRPAVSAVVEPAVAVPSLSSTFITEAQSRFTWPYAAAKSQAQAKAGSDPSSDSAPSSRPLTPSVAPSADDFNGTMTADSLSSKFVGHRNQPEPLASSDSKSVVSSVSGASPRSPKQLSFRDGYVRPSSAAWQPKYDGAPLRPQPSGLPQNRPSSAPAARRRQHVHTEKRVYHTHDDFNPILMHKRYPGNTDRQSGRWTTESSTSFTWKKR